jgi:hypothetical protein
MKRLLPSAFTLLSLATLAIAPGALAYVASSSNYRIQADSVNGAGLLSTSSSYRIEDTVGESGVGTSSSATFSIKAGYQQMQDVYLALAPSGNISLAPAIPSTGGGSADGSAVFTVTTDNIAGYTMSIQSSGVPALVSGANNFPNYVPGGVDPDFTFTTPAASSRFGMSPEGSDIVQRFKDNGAACNAGALDTASACWDAITTTPTTIAGRSSPNNPSGTATTIRFHAGSGASNTQAAGSYTATATVTVIPL